MSVSEAPPLPQLAGRVEGTTNMASNEEDDEEQTSDNEDVPYIKCEAVYGDDGGEEDYDEISALPFVSTEMREYEVDEDDEEESMKFGMKAPEVGAYVKCSVPSCHSYFEVGNPKYEGFSHFKFPKDLDMRSRWIGIIGQKSDWNPDGAMICSNHFTESAFVTHLEHVAETGQLMPKRTLKPGAMPTMNLDLPGSWGRQRIGMPPNNGVLATPVVPAVHRPVVQAPTPPSIRSPYCQARTVNLTKNGKRRGRPPKNRPPDDYNSSITQLLASQTTRIDPPTQIPTQTSSAPPTNGVTQAMIAQSSAAPVVPSNTYGVPRPLPPFQLLDMGKRKRGRPRKEETLRRIADGVAADFGWRGGWRRSIPVKRRRILPTPENVQGQLQQQERQRRVEQLECSIDPSNFLMNQEAENDGSMNMEREKNLLYFKSLASNLTDLRSSSLRELRCTVESTLVTLRRADATANAKKEAMERLMRLEEEAARRIEPPKKGTDAKEKQVGVDMKLPPSLSIKPVTKGSNHSSSFVDEEPTPALTITIKREKLGSAVNGKAFSPREELKMDTESVAQVRIKQEEINIRIKTEVFDTVMNPENSRDSETEDNKNVKECEENVLQNLGDSPAHADVLGNETNRESSIQSNNGDDVDRPKDGAKNECVQGRDDHLPEQVCEQSEDHCNGEEEDSSGTEDSDDEDSDSQEDGGTSSV